MKSKTKANKTKSGKKSNYNTKITISDLLQVYFQNNNSRMSNLIAFNIRSVCSKVSILSSYCSQFDDMKLILITVTVIFGLLSLYISFHLSVNSNKKPETKPEEEVVEEIIPRDFTKEQLLEFNGNQEKPIYIALKGEVYDVSSAKQMYGPDTAYHCFAGRDASRAMAKLSFDEVDLTNSNIDDISPFERDTLNDWIEKFKYYKAYPIVGKISTPPPVREMKREELVAFKGTQEVPEGRVDAPIYLGINR